MEDSKALSPRVKALYEKVRKQATEYSEAFEVISMQVKEAENLKKEVDEKLEYLELLVDASIEDVHNKVEASLEETKNRTSKILDTYEELENISKLADSLQMRSELFKSLSTKMTESLSDFETNAATYLDNLIKEVKTKTDKVLSSETNKLELKISVKIRSFENTILNLEDRINGFLNTQYAKGRKRVNDVESLKDKFDSMKRSFDNMNVMVVERFGKFDSEINKKIRVVEQTLDKFREKLMIEIYGSIEPKSGEKPESHDTLKKNIQTIEQKLGRLEVNFSRKLNIYKIAIGFSGLTIVILLGMLLF